MKTIHGFNVALVVCSGVLALSRVAVGADVYPLGAYVQDDSLIAWWDGEYNSVVDGKPVHKADATQWDSLVSGAEAFKSDSLDYQAQSVVYRGKRLPTKIDNMPQIRTTPVTVQIVARCVEEGNLSQSHQLFSTWHGDFGLLYDVSTFAGSTLGGSTIRVVLTTSMRNLQVNTFIFNDGGFCLYENLNRLVDSKQGTYPGQPTPSTDFTIGSSRETRCHYEYFAIRVYSRKLSQDEIRQNLVADMNRFGFCPDGFEFTGSIRQMGFSLPITRDSYVQDGLYAQWDGICNATSGTPHHCENPTQWEDLKGNAPPFVSQNSLTFKEDCVTVSKCTAISIPWLAGDYKEWTMEVAACCSLKTGNTAMDTVLYSPYGGLAYFSKTSHLTGSAPFLGNSEYKRYEITGPEVPGDDPGTYSLAFADGFARVTINGQDAAVTRGAGKDPVDKTDTRLRLGSERNPASEFDCYSVRIYDRPLSTDEQRQNALVDRERFFGKPIEPNLIVTGDRRCVGTVSPQYGKHVVLKEGVTVLCTASAESTNRRLLGYEVQTNGVDGAWGSWFSGTNTSFYLAMPNVPTKVVWRWKPQGLVMFMY